MIRYSLGLFVLSAACLLTACGGKGGSDGGPAAGGEMITPPEPQVLEASFSPDPDRSGSLYQRGAAIDRRLLVGDTEITNDPYRAFLQFLLDLPAGARIVEAHLEVAQERVRGTPYQVLGGGLQVAHVLIGAMLDGADYDGNVLADGIGTLSEEDSLVRRRVEVTDAVRDDLEAGRSASGFRLAFPVATDGDGGTDLTFWYDAGDRADAPALIVRYIP